MLRGDWRHYAALGLVAAAALFAGWWLTDTASRSQTLIEQQASEKAAAYAYRARVHVEQYCVRLSPADKHDCAHEAAQTARDGAHDEHDLEAQLVTSVWTHYMGLAAIGGTSFGIIGIFLILATFRENKRAANAAHDANRPWINVSASGISLWAGQRGANVVFTYALHNHGNSPATGVTVFAFLIAVPRDGIRPPNPMMRAIRGSIKHDVGKDDYGSAIFPSNNESGELAAEAGEDEIASASGNGARQLRYLLAVGARYRFGNRTGYSVRCYDIFVREKVIYDVPGDSRAVRLHDVTDTYEGFAT